MKRAHIARALRQNTTPRKQTNFERITESPEALAEYINCKGCRYRDTPECFDCKAGRVAWLNEEYK